MVDDLENPLESYNIRFKNTDPENPLELVYVSYDNEINKT